MNTNKFCGLPWDTGYANACQICGIPVDANNFDVANIIPAPREPGKEEVLAKFALPPQYCGVLLYFAQYVEPVLDVITAGPQNREIFRTPGYEWVILCNNQPRDPYLPTRLLLNPWGYNALPVHLRLEEGCVVRLVVRKVSPPADEPETPLAFVGGRLLGRYWYNTIYGGAPHRL